MPSWGLGLVVWWAEIVLPPSIISDSELAMTLGGRQVWHSVRTWESYGSKDGRRGSSDGSQSQRYNDEPKC